MMEIASGAGTWTLELPGRRMAFSKPLAELLGLSRDEGAAPVLSLDEALQFYATESRELMAAAFDACMKNALRFDEEVHVTTAHGQRLWTRVIGEAVRDASGAVVRIHGMLQDLTAKKRSENESMGITMRLSTTLASIEEAFVTIDKKGVFTYVNRESERLLQRESAELLGRKLWDELDAAGTGRLRREIHAVCQSGLSVEFEEYYVPLEKWLELRAYPFEEGIAVYFRDVTAWRQSQEQLLLQTSISRLNDIVIITEAGTLDAPGPRIVFVNDAFERHTGYSRSEALGRTPRLLQGQRTQRTELDRIRTALRQALSRTAYPEKIGALMFIDLDNFKVLNDTRGHATDDLLLQKVASRLNACVRLRDTVARLGGDEFVVLLEDLGDDPDIARGKARVVAQKILASLCEPCELAGHTYDGTCSIGIAPIHPNQQSMGDLLKQADLAMYQAKAAGRNALCFFDPQMQAAATASAALSSELRLSLRKQDFLLHYQPQVNRNGMFGVEALVRWKHPERGVVYPYDFIAQAEESGLILPLGQWVLETACAQLARWAKRPVTANLSIAVNVSVRQFRHPDFVDMVMAAISQAGIRADLLKLKLELTESLLAIDMEVTVARMGTLKRAGVTLSIDDFGIGYSALSYLKHLPLDQLKIDRNFVKDILTDPNDAAIARTIIGLAQSLGLGVVAEGVETEAQRELLARFGCDSYQGHLFCRALPIDELEIFMAKLPASARPQAAASG